MSETFELILVGNVRLPKRKIVVLQQVLKDDPQAMTAAADLAKGETTQISLDSFRALQAKGIVAGSFQNPVVETDYAHILRAAYQPHEFGADWDWPTQPAD